MGLFQPPAGKTCSTLVAADVKGDPGDPLAALEPGTTYSVVLNPALAGRNSADKVLLDDKAKALLKDIQALTARYQSLSPNDLMKLSIESPVVVQP